MWVDAHLAVRFAPELARATGRDATALRWLCGFDGAPLRPPKHFTPDHEFLRRHAAVAQDLVHL